MLSSSSLTNTGFKLPSERTFVHLTFQRSLLGIDPTLLPLRFRLLPLADWYQGFRICVLRWELMLIDEGNSMDEVEDVATLSRTL
jgi:hypothetical protein